MLMITVIFPKDNKIKFFQDHWFWEGVPDNVDFYLEKATDVHMVFIGDRHGIQKDNKFGLYGRYGNGSIYIDKKNI